MDIFGFNITRNRRRNKPLELVIKNPDRIVGKFAQADVLGCFQMIERRALNATITSDIRYIYTSEVIDFVMSNLLQLQQRMFYYGFVCINTTNLTFVDKDTTIGWDKVTMYLAKDEVAMIDPVYAATGKTGANVLRPYLMLLDTVNNADLNLIDNYGAMGILSPENSSINEGFMDEKDKEQLQKDYNNVHGVKMGKWNIMISRKALKYTPIELPIEALHLDDRRKEAVAGILQYLNIPKELHPFFENVKYANRNEAELDFYNGAIHSLLDMVIRLCTMIYDNHRMFDNNFRKVSFAYTIDNVWALQEAIKVKEDRLSLALNNASKLKEIDLDMYNNKIKQIKNQYGL